MKVVVIMSIIWDIFLFIFVVCVFLVVILFLGWFFFFKEKIVVEYRVIMIFMGVVYMLIKLNLWYNIEEFG